MFWYFFTLKIKPYFFAEDKIIKQIIDCHTHLQTENLINEYFANREGYAIAIKSLDFLISNGDDSYTATIKYNNIFICECIDVLKPISQQLQLIKKYSNKFRTIGIKIYLGYQPVMSDDSKLFPIYEFAKENNLSIVFHCGVGTENLDKANYKKASCLPIENVARMYPEVNFIASHFDYPNFDDCANIVCNNNNIFTNISGAYENFDNKPYNQLINEFVTNIKPTIDKFGKNNYQIR